MSRALCSSAALAACLIAPGVAMAQTETRVSADVYATGGYSGNPFGGQGNKNTGSAYGTVGVKPRVELHSARSVISAGGDVQVQHYVRRYSTVDSYSGYLDYAGTPSERLNTRARLSFDDGVIGSYNSFATIDPTDPSVPTTGDDLSLFGSRDRRRSYHGQAGATATLTARDQLNVSFHGDVVRFKRLRTVGNYNGYGSTLGYMRQVSEHAQVGIQGSASLTDYTARGNTRVYSLQATGSFNLAASWTLKGAVGVSFLDDDMTSGTSKSLSGNLSLCRNVTRSSICVNVVKAVLPTAVSGTRDQTIADATYRYQLTEHSSINARGSYTHAERKGLGPAGRNEYFMGSVGYDRKVTERLNVSSSVFYRAIFGGTSTRGDDYGGQIGLTYRFGDPR
ncbi:hypothetical protein [Sphingomonas sp.]|uniref:hypothetical protein n=1 Tax=Sphingomonas sp. TaxID=28214 RepID=UPI001B1E42E7|nr:hypothetical protein [Sphingomonas sp.]MBO9714540.1 hypothetical protein [Sphingomonas sp.]